MRILLLAWSLQEGISIFMLLTVMRRRSPSPTPGFGWSPWVTLIALATHARLQIGHPDVMSSATARIHKG
jgi:hypothetical protein